MNREASGFIELINLHSNVAEKHPARGLGAEREGARLFGETRDHWWIFVRQGYKWVTVNLKENNAPFNCYPSTMSSALGIITVEISTYQHIVHSETVTLCLMKINYNKISTLRNDQSPLPLVFTNQNQKIM